MSDIWYVDTAKQSFENIYYISVLNHFVNNLLHVLAVPNCDLCDSNADCSFDKTVGTTCTCRDGYEGNGRFCRGMSSPSCYNTRNCYIRQPADGPGLAPVSAQFLPL